MGVKISEIVAHYGATNLVTEDTGGGCSALVYQMDDGARIMITSVANECCAPDDSDETVLCGYYEDEDANGEVTEVPMAELVAWLDKQGVWWS
jgi:hypothetical protein